MSARNVGDNTKCRCTLGSDPSYLGVASCKTIQLRGGVTGLNIYDQNFLGPFGECHRDKKKSLPCTPKPDGAWSNDAPGVYFGGAPTLVETATMRCAYGGEISIVDPGQVTDVYSGRNCDELFVGADGRAIIARGTCEEVAEMKRREEWKEFDQRAENYLNNPFLEGLGALADTLTESKESKEILRPPVPGPRRFR